MSNTSYGFVAGVQLKHFLCLNLSDFRLALCSLFVLTLDVLIHQRSTVVKTLYFIFIVNIRNMMYDIITMHAGLNGFV